VFTEDYGAALHTRRKLNRISLCHIVAAPLVVGGVNASEMEFPHMVKDLSRYVILIMIILSLI